MDAAQSQLRSNREYDTIKENRLRLLGSRLILPEYSDLYYRKKVEDKINELIKKELVKETTSDKPKTDNEMIKLVKTLIKKFSSAKTSKKKSAKKKSAKKKPSKKKSAKKKPSKKKSAKKKK